MSSYFGLGLFCEARIIKLTKEKEKQKEKEKDKEKDKEKYAKEEK